MSVSVSVVSSLCSASGLRSQIREVDGLRDGGLLSVDLSSGVKSSSVRKVALLFTVAW